MLVYHWSYPIDIFHDVEHKPRFYRRRCDPWQPQISLSSVLCKFQDRMDSPGVFKLRFIGSFISFLS